MRRCWGVHVHRCSPAGVHFKLFFIAQLVSFTVSSTNIWTESEVRCADENLQLWRVFWIFVDPENFTFIPWSSCSSWQHCGLIAFRRSCNALFVAPRGEKPWIISRQSLFLKSNLTLFKRRIDTPCLSAAQILLGCSDSSSSFSASTPRRQVVGGGNEPNYRLPSTGISTRALSKIISPIAAGPTWAAILKMIEITKRNPLAAEIESSLQLMIEHGVPTLRDYAGRRSTRCDHRTGQL